MCGEAYTLENKSFIYLSCREILCYSCSKIDESNVPKSLDVCPYCEQKEVLVTDLGKEIDDSNTSNIISGPKEILSSLSIEQFMSHVNFKNEQVKLIREEVERKKKRVSDGEKLIEDAKKEISRLRSSLDLIKVKEKTMKKEVKALGKKYKELIKELGDGIDNTHI